MVNPSEQPKEISLSIDEGFRINNAELSLIAPDDLKAGNTMNMPSTVRVSDQKLSVTGNVIQLKLPRWSVGVISIND